MPILKKKKKKPLLIALLYLKLPRSGQQGLQRLLGPVREAAPAARHRQVHQAPHQDHQIISY